MGHMSHVYSPNQFPGSEGTSTGPAASRRQGQRHFLWLAQPFPPGLHLLVGRSPDPSPLSGSDPCLGLTRSLRMFMSSEVTTGKEVTPSHLPACLPGPTPSMLLSVPSEASGGSEATNLTASTSCFPGEAPEVQRGQGAFPRKNSTAQPPWEGFLLSAALDGAGWIPRGRKKRWEGEHV